MRPFCLGILVLQPIPNTANSLLTLGSYAVRTGRGGVLVIAPSIPCEAPGALATPLCTWMLWSVMVLDPLMLLLYLVWYYRKVAATSPKKWFASLWSSHGIVEVFDCPASRTTLVATRFRVAWSVPLFKCLTVLEFSFILFDLCLLITFFNFIMNYVPIVTFWIFTYHKIWILSIMFCFIWSYWSIYFLACLEVSWRVVS